MQIYCIRETLWSNSGFKCQKLGDSHFNQRVVCGLGLFSVLHTLLCRLNTSWEENCHKSLAWLTLKGESDMPLLFEMAECIFICCSDTLKKDQSCTPHAGQMRAKFLIYLLFWVISTAQRNILNNFFFLHYQERGYGNSKGLLVKICATEEEQDISSVLRLVELQELSQFPQLIQIWRELQPARTCTLKVSHINNSSFMKREGC